MWEAAVAVTASAYGVDAALIAAPSRGRGPRPPAHIWQAKKMAVHLAVIVADQGYKALAVELGMHKDTVCSHCADMRTVAETDQDLEDLSVGLERAVRLRAASLALAPVEIAASDPLDRMLSAMRDYADSFIRPSSDQNGLHPTKTADHGNVITTATVRR